VSRRSGGGAPSGLQQALRLALTGPVEELGLVLEDVEVTPAGSRRLLRVLLDVGTDDGSLSLDDVAAASRAINAVLDGEQGAPSIMGEAPYVLEVSSPGVDRPITEPHRFRRNLRRVVQVDLADGSQVTGRVTSADDVLVLSVPGPKKGMLAVREIGWDDVRRGLVQVEFTAVRPQDDLTSAAEEAAEIDTDDETLTDESED
jgi:ribosome maturation factor RimP